MPNSRTILISLSLWPTSTNDQLSQADIRALFHYYLLAMWKHEAVRKYVLDDENGYDYLKKLLPKLMP
jgi:hypothetical protein